MSTGCFIWSVWSRHSWNGLNVLRDQKPYNELGGTYFDERHRQATEKRLVRRLEKLGYEVALKSASPAA